MALLAQILGVTFPFFALVLVLVAALPSASNVPMLAERFGADAGRIAMIVLVTTALAFLTFSLTVATRVPASRLASASSVSHLISAQRGICALKKRVNSSLPVKAESAGGQLGHA